MKLNDDIINFLHSQGFVIVSTIDKAGMIHTSAKGIVGIEPEGKIFIVDLYKAKTYGNLKRDPRVSITAVDEHKFMGFNLQGKAKIVMKEDMGAHIVKAWEEKIVQRITKRMLRGVQSGSKSKTHFEAKLLPQPKYVIEVDVENIIDLAPPGMSRAED